MLSRLLCRMISQNGDDDLCVRRNAQHSVNKQTRVQDESLSIQISSREELCESRVRESDSNDRPIRNSVCGEGSVDTGFATITWLSSEGQIFRSSQWSRL